VFNTINNVGSGCF